MLVPVVSGKANLSIRLSSSLPGRVQTAFTFECSFNPRATCYSAWRSTFLCDLLGPIHMLSHVFHFCLSTIPFTSRRFSLLVLLIMLLCSFSYSCNFAVIHFGWL